MTFTYEQGAVNQPVIENKIIIEKQSNSQINCIRIGSQITQLKTL